MPNLKNPKHERFAQLRASGKSGSEAYRAIMGKGARNADVHADEWTRMLGVRERIEELQAETARKCSLTREQFLESLVAMYQGKPGEATLDNPLCDSLICRGVRHSVFPPKAVIANQLAKLCGWDAPTKVEVEAGENLSGFLGRLFVSGGTLGNGGENGENGQRSKQASSPASGIRH
jgi:hypothetical protein